MPWKRILLEGDAAVLTSTVTPVAVDFAAAQIGTSTEAARADHKHSATAGSPVALDGLSANGTSNAFVRADHKHCFSEDTEILTAEGWKFFHQLKKGELALTMNKSGFLEYQPIDEIYTYPGKHEMVHFLNRDVDLLVTKEHRIVYDTHSGAFERGQYNWKIRTAESCLRGVEIELPVSGLWLGKGLDEDDAIIELLGWVVGDGTLPVNEDRVRITQRIDRVPLLQTIASEAGVSYTVTNHFRGGYNKFPGGKLRFCKPVKRVNLSARDGRRIRPYIKVSGKWQKFFTRNLMNEISVNQIEKLLRGLIASDGHQYSSTYRTFTTTCKLLADQVQELCIKSGYRCIIDQRDNRYDLYITPRSTVRVSHKTYAPEIHTELYYGIVWCVSVPNGTVVVRRNGKHVITGNSLGPLATDLNFNEHEADKLALDNLSAASGYVTAKLGVVYFDTLDRHPYIYIG
jgi:replicative DNA helicase Mcm